MNYLRNPLDASHVNLLRIIPEVGEFAMQFKGGIAVCFGGFFESFVRTDSSLLAIDVNSCDVALIAGTPMNSLYASLTVASNCAIPKIFRMRTDSKIGSPIIQSISVDMINQHPRRGAHQDPMHLDRTLFGRDVGLCIHILLRSGISGLASPPILQKHLNIGFIHNRMAVVKHGELDTRDCKLTINQVTFKFHAIPTTERKRDGHLTIQTVTRRGGVCGDHLEIGASSSDRILACLDLTNHRLNSRHDGIRRANLSDVAGQDVRDGWLTAPDSASDLALRATSLDKCANQALKINIHGSMIVTTINEVNRNFGRPIDKNSYMDKPYDLMTVGGRVRYAREKLAKPKRLSQRALARMAGMSQPTLWALENGEGETARIVDLATALNVNPRWLARGEGEAQIDADQSPDDQTLEKSPIVGNETSLKESDNMLSLDGISEEMRVIIKELARIDRIQGRRRGILVASIGAIIATTEPAQDEPPIARARN